MTSFTGSAGNAVPVPTRVLSNGVEIPALGLGVYQSHPGHTTRDAVAVALDAGYRHIDTAAVYRNEVDVGEAVRGVGDRMGSHAP